MPPELADFVASSAFISSGPAREDLDAFTRFRDAILAATKPDGGLEEFFVGLAIGDGWRQLRLLRGHSIDCAENATRAIEELAKTQATQRREAERSRLERIQWLQSETGRAGWPRPGESGYEEAMATGEPTTSARRPSAGELARFRRELRKLLEQPAEEPAPVPTHEYVNARAVEAQRARLEHLEELPVSMMSTDAAVLEYVCNHRQHRLQDGEAPDAYVERLPANARGNLRSDLLSRERFKLLTMQEALARQQLHGRVLAKSCGLSRDQRATERHLLDAVSTALRWLEEWRRAGPDETLVPVKPHSRRMPGQNDTVN